MIMSFSANMAGPYHVDEGIPCQDSYWISTGKGSFTVVTCADGLGSERHSDVGSSIAAKVAAEYCAKSMHERMDFAQVKAIMNNAFVMAYKSILEEAAKSGNPDHEYDTTLCLAIYDGSHLYYGQSGDSGIVALLESGEFFVVTKQQRDEMGLVYPLCFGPDYWEFGEVETPVSAVMVMTDGVLDQICPPILKTNATQVNVALAKKFLVQDERNDERVREIEHASRTFLENYPRRLLDDDKTFVVLYNPDLPAELFDTEYYAVPKWDEIYKQARSVLYSMNDEVCLPIDSSSTNEALPSVLDEKQEKLSDPHWLENDNQAEIESTRSVSLDSVYLPPQSLSSGSHVVRVLNPRHAASFRWIHWCTVLMVIAFSGLTWGMRDLIIGQAPQGYAGILSTTFLLDAALFLPSSSINVVLSNANLMHPLVVVLMGAIGVSLGEMMGFYTGASVGCLVKETLIHRMSRLLSTRPYLVVLVASALPIPVFDLVGILAGAIKLHPIKFFASCLAGNGLKMACFVWPAAIIAALV
jgi:membrane protein DedA with SNARE-associated domain